MEKLLKEGERIYKINTNVPIHNFLHISQKWQKQNVAVSEQVTTINSEHDVALSALQDQVIPQFQRGLFSA